LHAICSERLQPFGYEPEGRPFAAHLTIARFTDVRSAESRAIRAAVADLRVEPMRWTVERVTIFRSHLSSRGPRYEPLAHATLVVPLT
jgi:2'-5' RNA ligase